jgi:hypothetical protein
MTSKWTSQGQPEMEEQSNTSGSIVKTDLTIPTSLTMSSMQLTLLQSWIVKPQREVGPTTVGLLQADSGRDYANRAGTKSQAYTSWDSFSRSYVASYSFSTIQGRRTKRYAGLEDSINTLDPDTPTEKELASWTAVDRDMYALGKKQFFRGIGLLTAKQRQAEKYIRLLKGRCAREETTESESDDEDVRRVTRALSSKKKTKDTLPSALQPPVKATKSKEPEKPTKTATPTDESSGDSHISIA